MAALSGEIRELATAFERDGTQPAERDRLKPRRGEENLETRRVAAPRCGAPSPLRERELAPPEGNTGECEGAPLAAGPKAGPAPLGQSQLSDQPSGGTTACASPVQWT